MAENDQERDWEEYRQALRSLGTPEQVVATFKAMEALLQERKHRAWLMQSVRTIATYAAAVLAGWLAIKAIALEILPWLSR